MTAYKGCTTISDSAGNLLFYSNGVKVWNKNHNEMQNGYGLLGDELSSQAVLGLKAPGADNLYYLFTVGGNHGSPPLYGAYYSVIDMSLDGGAGSVLSWEKNIPLQGADSAAEVITAVACADRDGYWVFVRNFSATNKILAYLVDADGVHQTPVISLCLRNQSILQQIGTVKASSDGRYMVYGPSGWAINIPVTELYRLNSSTGEVTPVFLFNSGGINWGAEFASNSEYLYLTIDHQDSSKVVQYDMNQLSNATTFQNSKSIINVINGGPTYWQCQLATDGKIYISQYLYSLAFAEHLSVINEPSKKGAFCNFQSNAVELASGYCMMGLPTFVQSYFARFTWNGECMNAVTQFTSNFNPVPDSIIWDFDDPSTGTYNNSNDLNPIHIFSDTGSYNVKVKAFYANGHQEDATRIVRISPQPMVSLGPDQFICPNSQITLDAGSGFLSYQWSTGQATQTIQVADTGTYWVRVSNSSSCAGYDTIHVNFYPAPVIDETGLVISPTTCGGSTGAITGLIVTGNQPVSYEWKNGNNQIVSTNLDLFQLPVDNYTLFVTDGYGCSWPSRNFTINDVGDLLIDTVIVQQAHCGKADAKITIVATTGLAAMLKYSIDNGQSYSYNLGDFYNPTAGIYKVKVMVSDTTQPCQKVYDFNPVIVQDLGSPLIINVSTQFENGTQADGSIAIQASSASDTLFYLVDGMEQVNNGTFNNLHSGTYTCTVTDKYGCDTTFTAVVNNLTVARLQAIAGDGSTCLGEVAVLPLLANNFDRVSSFNIRLKYDNSKVICQNYLNPATSLADSLKIELYPESGELNLKWADLNPVSLPDGTTLVELSFASLNSGQSTVKWDLSPGICVFLDSIGFSLPAEFTQGQVRVYSIPKAEVPEPLPTCEGGDVLLIANYQAGTGNGTISYNWTGPGGFTSYDPIFTLTSLTQAEAGLYTVSVSDTNHCLSDYTAEVNVIPTPVAGFTADTIYFDEQVQLEVEQGYYKYTWNTGDSTYSVLVSAEGWYKVSIETVEGCTTTDSVMMLYAFVPLNMPNAFTPDGDGLNDYFKPVTLPEKISSFSMYIYDRWGKQVFFTNDVKQGWDGTINGNPAQVGSYAYVLKYGNPSGAQREKRGMVTLVR
jgi:gliding motility-associated-like protein